MNDNAYIKELIRIKKANTVEELEMLKAEIENKSIKRGNYTVDECRLLHRIRVRKNFLEKRG